MKKLLTIAGSDPSGGAGIQADLKTFAAHGHYGMSVITSLTAQNTMGVKAIHTIPVDFFDQQLCAVLEDIQPDAVKIGMVGSAELLAVVVKRLKQFQIQKLVVDPVMVSTSGHALIQEDALQMMKQQLLCMADIITPNLAEAQVLSGMSIQNKADMEQAGRALKEMYDGAILIKGGHLANCADDLLIFNHQQMWLCAPHIDTHNTHGTGCTLSSAIACHLALGKDIASSVKDAKAYIQQCLKDGMDIGHGNGPLNHLCTQKAVIF